MNPSNNSACKSKPAFTSSQYVQWAFNVKQPMTIEYQKHRDYVTVKINPNFITSNVCNECERDGPHHGPDHVFKITLTKLDNGTREMRIFNDYNVHCTIPPNTKTYKILKMFAFGSANTCYFYGIPDEDDPSTLYIHVRELPPQ